MTGHDIVDLVYAERNMQQATDTFRMDRAEVCRVCCMELNSQVAAHSYNQAQHHNRRLAGVTDSELTDMRREKNKTKKVRERKE